MIDVQDPALHNEGMTDASWLAAGDCWRRMPPCVVPQRRPVVAGGKSGAAILRSAALTIYRRGGLLLVESILHVGSWIEERNGTSYPLTTIAARAWHAEAAAGGAKKVPPPPREKKRTPLAATGNRDYSGA